MATTLYDTARAASASGIGELLNSGTGGTLEFRAGASGTGAVLLLAAAAFASNASGVCTFAAITQDTAATGTGVIEKAITGAFYDSAGDLILEGDCTGSGGAAAFVFATTTTVIPRGADVSITTLTYTQPA